MKLLTLLVDLYLKRPPRCMVRQPGSCFLLCSVTQPPLTRRLLPSPSIEKHFFILFIMAEQTAQCN